MTEPNWNNGGPGCKIFHFFISINEQGDLLCGVILLHEANLGHSKLLLEETSLKQQMFKTFFMHLK